MTKLDDTVLRQRVAAELDWDPTVDASAIDVAANNGVVTLTGSVGSYPHRNNAERAAKRIPGVRAVADELTVELPPGSVREDADIAQSALAALKSYHGSIPCERVRITVEDGWITLDGEIESCDLRTAAQKAVQHVLGVKGLNNALAVPPPASPAEVKARIEDALARRAASDSGRIEVEVIEDHVILRGSVHSWQAKEDAEQAACHARGVTRVQDDLMIMPTRCELEWA